MRETQSFDFAQDRELVERPFGFTQGHELVEWQMAIFQQPAKQPLNRIGDDSCVAG
jgi:hypothetical protein